MQLDRAGCLLDTVNHIDISPNFAGTLMGISNCVSNSFGTMAPITAGFVLKDDTDPAQWRKVFFIAASIAFSTNLFYIFFGSSVKAPWNEADYFDKKSEEMTTMKEINNKTESLHKEENEEERAFNK